MTSSPVEKRISQPRQVSRQAFLACILLSAIAGACIPAVARAQGATSPAKEVAPVDLSKIKPSDFADNELDMPFYLVNFHTVANAVPLEGPDRGWMTIQIWRSGQQRYNARIMESQLSLAYFYCTKRPWNPYYGDPAVRARLEAMLEHWCAMQGENGEFSEYAAKAWNLPSTAFATKFTGAALRLLAQGPPIDPELHKKAESAMRRAMMAVFTDPALWEHGKTYSNQYANVFAGAAQWLSIHPEDKEIREHFLKSLQDSREGLMSPAGYYYEHDGADFGYSLTTTNTNLEVAWHFAKGTEFEPLIKEEIERFNEWLGWNLTLEPDGSGFAVNHAIETRQRHPWVDVTGTNTATNFYTFPAGEEVESARAFLANKDEMAAKTAHLRAALENQWPNIPVMRPGQFRSYTPYTFLARDLKRWYPTAEQQKAAREKLPSIMTAKSAHLLADNRKHLSFLYIRRPNYYVAFNGGERIIPSQRYGLGLLWNSDSGTLAQAQSGSNIIWGTSSEAGKAPFEADGAMATYAADGKEVAVKPGSTDLGDGDVSVDYALGKAGKKSIRFEDDKIAVDVQLPGQFSETIPVMMKDGDRLTTNTAGLQLMRGDKAILAIAVPEGSKASIGRVDDEVGPYAVRPIRIAAKDSLKYSVSVPAK